MRQQLIKRLEEVRPGPGEAKALVERMKHGTSSERAARGTPADTTS